MARHTAHEDRICLMAGPDGAPCKRPGYCRGMCMHHYAAQRKHAGAGAPVPAQVVYRPKWEYAGREDELIAAAQEKAHE